MATASSGNSGAVTTSPRAELTMSMARFAILTLRITAQNADIWHGFGDVETLAHKQEVLNGWCEKVGRDPSEIERSCGIRAETLDRIDDIAALGYSFFTVSLNGPDYDSGVLRDVIAWRDRANKS